MDLLLFVIFLFNSFMFINFIFKIFIFNIMGSSVPRNLKIKVVILVTTEPEIS